MKHSYAVANSETISKGYNGQMVFSELYGHLVSAGVVPAVVIGKTCGNTCTVANEA